MIRTSHKLLLAGAGGLAALIALASAVHPFGDPRRTGAGAQNILTGARIPSPLRELVERKCGNCHSEAVAWPLYSRVAPVSWLVEHDVIEARAHMNLSRWGIYGDEEKLNLLARLAAEVRNGEMPPGRYTLIHRDSKLTPTEQEALYEWTRTERMRLRVNKSQGTNKE